MEKKISILLIGIIVLLIIPLVYAIHCIDSFSSNSEVIQICAYCSETNGTICSQSRQCNISIYHSNFTLFVRNKSITNYGDGSLIYNISQYDGINKNLSDGSYFGYLFCGPRSHDDFDFTIYTPIKQMGAAYSRTIISQEKEKVILKNRIPNDITFLLNKIGGFLYSQKPQIGKIIFSIFFLILLFSKEIYYSLKKIKTKQKW